MIPQPSFQQFICLSGLPRSGSTLLSAILCQNPIIHAEGNSAVCQLMWDIQFSCNNNSIEQLSANNRIETAKRLISSVSHVYYEGIREKVVIDKCRSWTLEPNIALLRNYIDQNIKVIVLERPVTDIVRSFAKLHTAAGSYTEEKMEEFVKLGSEPIMRSLAGVLWAKENNLLDTFLFVQYDDLVSRPKQVIERIYAFCGWEPFEHRFDNIVVKYPENDNTYSLPGQHVVRSTISKSSNDTYLTQSLAEQCRKIDEAIGNSVENMTITLS